MVAIVVGILPLPDRSLQILSILFQILCPFQGRLTGILPTQCPIHGILLFQLVSNQDISQ